MTFEEWLAHTHKVVCTNVNKSQLRLGQNFFNSLCDVRPDLAEQIRGTNLDPFYLDDRVESFLTWVGENW